MVTESGKRALRGVHGPAFNFQSMEISGAPTWPAARLLFVPPKYLSAFLQLAFECMAVEIKAKLECMNEFNRKPAHTKAKQDAAF